MLRTGVDIIEVSRIDEAILRHGDRFFQRFFTPQELIDAEGRTPALAARFAAKEAVAKALGCGIGDVRWKEIEIVRDGRHSPQLRLHGAAEALARALGLVEWAVSLSHTHEHAMALVVAQGAPKEAA
ncbi:MAG: holo-ACP synthase [Anaerolineales bacterium]|nr:holo-ACP synthase [Anaerolineales bacterium]